MKYLLTIIVFFVFLPQLYSQNKIHSFVSEEWKKIEEQEFIIYYPLNHDFLILKTVPKIKNTIQYYSNILKHKLTHQIVFFIYPSFQDFQSSHIIFDYLPEGVAGYTEPLFERVVIPYNGNWDDFLHTLNHEIVHSFQFDIIKNVYQDERIAIPLWIIEGMAEFLSIGTGSRMDEYIRDSVYAGKLTDLIELLSSRGYENYKIGQTVMYFIYTQWGIDAINLLFRNLLIHKDLQIAFEYTFQVDYFQFNQMWIEFIYNRYKNETSFKEEYKDKITFVYKSLEKGENLFRFKPAFSGDGKYFAYISADKIYPAIVIQKVPSFYRTNQEKEEKKYILRFLYDENFEEWQPLTTKLNFDFSSRYLYIPTRSKSKLAIIKFDIIEKKIKIIYKLNLSNIIEPSISRDGKLMVFSGTINGFTDIFILDLQSQNLKRITHDFTPEENPIFSENNRKIYFIKQNTIHSRDLIYGLTEKILELPVKIYSIRKGYFKVQKKWFYGLYFSANYKDKISLFFYNLENKDIYLISSNTRDVIHFEIFSNQTQTRIIYTTLEEGNYNFFLMDFSDDYEKLKEYYKIDKQNFFKELNNDDFIKSQNLEQIKTCCNDIYKEIYFRNIFEPYKPDFYRYGFPFIALTGAVDSSGNSSLALLGLISFSDLQNRQKIEAFLTYQQEPVILNGEFRYSYILSREEFQLGGYSFTGIFAIFNPLDLSLNYILYNPFQRLIYNSINGIYLNYHYYLHSYSKIGIQLNLGREEQIYAPQIPEQRKNNDVFKNHYNIRIFYLYENAKYTIFGPLDGYAFLLGYEIPIVSDKYLRELYQTVLEFRYYNLFKDFSLFAYRIFLGMQTGKDSKDFPYRIGGFSTIRGYEFQKFEGKYAFIMNFEYRFNFIEYLLFGFPFRWSLGLIRGIMFFDAGAAFDNPETFQAFDGKTRTTKDLKASIGIGIHWNNFLWFIFPGGIMKIEWASPYDGKRSLPFSKWEGRFSIGFNF